MSAGKWIEAEKGMKKKMTVLTLCATLFALCLPPRRSSRRKFLRWDSLGQLPPLSHLKGTLFHLVKLRLGNSTAIENAL